VKPNARKSTDTMGPHRKRLETYLLRIEQFDGHINAMMEVTPERARSEADHADDAELAGKSTGPLHGMIVALKDNIDTAGIRTTSGSRLYEEYIPRRDATVWRNMQEAGAIMIGKVGLHECVFGPTSQNEWFGRIRNPWNTEHIPGGSSGGSGAAVAAQFCDLALGTDTGGSVRIPSAMCGITGLRPTMGAVSNADVRPISPHLDTVGPMARSVEEVARAFDVMQGFDPEDETSRPAPADRDQSALDTPIEGLKIGIPSDFFLDDVDVTVVEAFSNAQATFAELGATIIPVDLKGTKQATQATPRIVVADAADYYRDAIEHQADSISDEVMRRMKLGFDVTGMEYANHMRSMYRWRREIANVFAGDVDLLMTPTIGIPAPSISESDDLLKLVGHITPFTMCWALAAVPTLALPAGFSENGLPVSVQLAASEFSERLLCRAGFAFQSVTDHHKAIPPLIS